MSNPVTRLWILFFVIAMLAGCVQTSAAKSSVGREDIAAKANFDLAIGYISKNKFVEAEEKLKKAIGFKPNYYEAYNALGVIYEESSAWRKALEVYEKAAQDPSYHLAQLNYARMLCSTPGQREREIRKGAKLFEKAGVDMLGANAATALTGAGICYKKIGQRATAELRLIEALKYSPGYPAALLELADLYHKNGKTTAAKTKLRSYFSVTSTPSVYAKELAVQLGVRI